MNAGDAQLTAAHTHIQTASNLLHELVGSRDIETAIACCKTAMYLVERARDSERAKRHHAARDTLIDVDPGL
jgi:hypothetical protein